MTLESLFQLAAKKCGSAEAVVAELGVSRQRLQDARTGGPPLRPERLVKLGLLAGVEPLEALRAGGRQELADLLAEAGRLERGELSQEERAFLYAFLRLPEKLRRLVSHVTKELSDADAGGAVAVAEEPAAPPGKRKRKAGQARTAKR